MAQAGVVAKMHAERPPRDGTSPDSPAGEPENHVPGEASGNMIPDVLGEASGAPTGETENHVPGEASGNMISDAPGDASGAGRRGPWETSKNHVLGEALRNMVPRCSRRGLQEHLASHSNGES